MFYLFLEKSSSIVINVLYMRKNGCKACKKLLPFINCFNLKNLHRNRLNLITYSLTPLMGCYWMFCQLMVKIFLVSLIKSSYSFLDLKIFLKIWSPLKWFSSILIFTIRKLINGYEWLETYVIDTVQDYHSGCNGSLKFFIAFLHRGLILPFVRFFWKMVRSLCHLLFVI